MVYKHLKFHYLSNKPEDYVAKEVRQEYLDEYNKTMQGFGSATVTEIIDSRLKANIITLIQANYLKDLDKTTQGIVYSASKNDDIYNALLSFDTRLTSDQVIRDVDKLPILLLSSTLRNFYKYRAEMGEEAKVTSFRDFCLFGAKASCWGSTILKSGLAAIKAGPAGGPLVVFTSWAAVAISFISGVVNTYTNTACNCDASTGGPTCYSIRGITVFYDNANPCDGNIKFVAWGDGPTPLTFTWHLYKTDQYGAFGQEVTSAGGVPTQNPLVNFVIPDFNQPYILLFQTTSNTCNPPATSPNYIFSIDDLVNGPGIIMINGPTTTTVGQNNTYSITGDALIRPKNTFNWTVSFPGTNTLYPSGSNTAITWGWNDSYPYTDPGISAQATNGCSGNQSVLTTLSVHVTH